MLLVFFRVGALREKTVSQPNIYQNKQQWPPSVSSETQSEFYGTYKKDTGDLAETMNEWVTNVVSATRDGSPARGHAHYDVVNGMPCLLLRSVHLVGKATSIRCAR